jgi:hypothetical protein
MASKYTHEIPGFDAVIVECGRHIAKKRGRRFCRIAFGSTYRNEWKEVSGVHDAGSGTTYCPSCAREDRVGNAPDGGYQKYEHLWTDTMPDPPDKVWHDGEWVSWEQYSGHHAETVVPIQIAPSPLPFPPGLPEAAAQAPVLPSTPLMPRSPSPLQPTLEMSRSSSPVATDPSGAASLEGPIHQPMPAAADRTSSSNLIQILTTMAADTAEIPWAANTVPIQMDAVIALLTAMIAELKEIKDILKKGDNNAGSEDTATGRS